MLIERRPPPAWIPPTHLLELRALVRLRKTLVDQLTEWLQRIHMLRFHHGEGLAVSRLDGRDAHEQLAALDLSPAAQRQITVALAVIAHVTTQLAPLDRDLKAFAPRPASVSARGLPPLLDSDRRSYRPLLVEAIPDLIPGASCFVRLLGCCVCRPWPERPGRSSSAATDRQCRIGPEAVGPNALAGRPYLRSR